MKRPIFIVRLVAGFDLVATGLLAIPATAPRLFEALYQLENTLSGVATAPSLAPVAWLFVNLAGVLGVLWAIVRLAMPLRSLSMADAVARCFVAALILYYVFGQSVPHAFLVFVATELFGTVLQVAAFWGVEHDS